MPTFWRSERSLRQLGVTPDTMDTFWDDLDLDVLRAVRAPPTWNDLPCPRAPLEQIDVDDLVFDSTYTMMQHYAKVARFLNWVEDANRASLGGDEAVVWALYRKAIAMATHLYTAIDSHRVSFPSIVAACEAHLGYSAA